VWYCICRVCGFGMYGVATAMEVRHCVVRLSVGQD
jgi:hypothetical protein